MFIALSPVVSLVAGILILVFPRLLNFIVLVFMSGFAKKSDTRWEGGTIYGPKSGNTYSYFMELENPDRIKVRGFIGLTLIVRTDYWNRVK